MAKASTRFVCQACGLRLGASGSGRCPECGEWNSLVEEAAQSGKPAGAVTVERQAAPIAEVERRRRAAHVDGHRRARPRARRRAGRRLAGAARRRSRHRQVDAAAAGARRRCARAGKQVLYVSGEESVQQTALRARRLGVRTPRRCMVLAETAAREASSTQADAMQPAVLAVDSVQTVHAASLESIPGSLGAGARGGGPAPHLRQDRGTCRSCWSATSPRTAALAGPKTLEHVVDCVLYFEGERTHSYRILRATKNRFGSTNEIGVFEMRAGGLGEVPNPSALFLAERPVGAPGSVVVASVEGIAADARRDPGAGRARGRHAAAHRARASMPTACRCCSRSSSGAPASTCSARTCSSTSPAACGCREPASDLGVARGGRLVGARPRDRRRTRSCFGEVGLAGEVRAVGARRAAARRGAQARLPSLRPARAVAHAAARHARARARRRARRRQRARSAARLRG